MEKKSCHEICFRDIPNDWDSALPIGNGRMGAMVFRRGHVLHIAVNHYDCYYHMLPKPLEKRQSSQAFQDPARTMETYEELCRRADKIREQGNTERSHYLRTLHPVQGTGRPSYRGASYPPGGELLLELDERAELEHSCLRLRIEEAMIVFEAGGGDVWVKARLWAARDKDGIVIELLQSRDGLWKSADMVLPAGIGTAPYETVYERIPNGLCMRTVYRDGGVGSDAQFDADFDINSNSNTGCHADSNSRIEAGFVQELALCFDGQSRTEDAPEDSGRKQEEEKDKKSQWKGGWKSGFCGLAGIGAAVKAVLSLQPGEGKAGQIAEELARNVQQAREQQRIYWQQFWKARVALPDKFLETVWYMQLYLLECSCGRGSAYPEQACGLSGLWDIRRPNMWGSLWYWDVNIQSTFWGCGCAGHPELLKLFCDGYLSYEQDIREYTRRVYGTEGWALDYPHTLYHCIQPWCAQFLWQYYQYSRDEEFLKEKAYPVFMEQIAFFRRLSETDEKGMRHIRYDISPEQGPVTADSVITISCIRRLIQMAAEAAKILGRPEEERKELETLKETLPSYPLTADGRRYKDSLLVQDDIFLRHPSVLMPVFPAEEVGAGEDTSALWERTLQYVIEHTETGTFGMGWLAAAAARLGRGRTALRLIYEKGLDYILHANGLAYEESERFLNYCHLTKPAHYLPVMMETAGGLVNAVNQMLLQTGKEGELLIFPAIPDETPDIMKSIVQYEEDDGALAGDYEDWREVSFDGLLAPGGFRISARKSAGRTVFLKVESSKEAVLRLYLPGELAEDGKSCLKEYRMKPGEVLCWGEEQPCGDKECGGEKTQTEEGGKTPCHIAARTGRRIFLGGDRHTPYYQAVDAFTCGYLLANEHRYMQTPYIFDFGTGAGEKPYEDSYPKQFAVAGRCVLYAAGPRRIGAEEYRKETGYGFRKTEGIRAADRGAPDDLRRDFLEGREEAVFVLSLPKGKYNLLLICGDEKEASYTKITLPCHGTAVSAGELDAGYFGSKILPVVQEQDGELEISISTEKGYCWKLNAMFVNKEYGIP